MPGGHPVARSSYSGARRVSDGEGWKDPGTATHRSHGYTGDMKYNDGLAPYPGLKTASAWVQSAVLQDRQAGGERTDLGEEDTCMRKEWERVVIVMSMYLIHMLLVGR